MVENSTRESTVVLICPNFIACRRPTVEVAKQECYYSVTLFRWLAVDTPSFFSSWKDTDVKQGREFGDKWFPVVK